MNYMEILLSFGLLFERSFAVDSQRPCDIAREEVLNSNFLDRPVPVCNEDGTFKTKQRNGFVDYCYCVDRLTGKIIEGKEAFCSDFNFNCDVLSAETTTTPVTTTKPLGLCEQTLNKAMASTDPNVFKPECTEQGTFKPLQRAGGFCWCTDVKTGEVKEGSFKSCDGFNIDCENLFRVWTVTETTHTTATTTTLPAGLCQQKQLEVAESLSVTTHMPSCNADGTFKAKQIGSAYCWCVDTVTGETREGTTQSCVRFDLDCSKTLEICKNPPTQYSASSTWKFIWTNKHYRAEEGRLNGIGWMSYTTELSKEYLQIDLGAPQYIAEVTTKGGKYRGWNEFFKKYMIFYKETKDSDFKYFQQYRINKVFIGNTDTTTPVTQNFKYGEFKAAVIRILPIEVNHYIYLRAEVSVYC